MRFKILYFLLTFLIVTGVCNNDGLAYSNAKDIKRVYEELYHILNVDQEQFMEYWMDDKSIADIASDKDISSWQLFQFLYQKELVTDIQDFLLFIHETRTPLEYSYKKIGYKSIDKALNDFEEHYKRLVHLPIKLPPIPFTIQLGRFTNLDGNINDDFEIEYINDKHPENHYQIWIKPSKYGLTIKNRLIDKTYTLKNGETAIYSTKAFRGANLLAFDYNGWQYVLSIDKRVSNKVTADTLLDIANSILFETEQY